MSDFYREDEDIQEEIRRIKRNSRNMIAGALIILFLAFSYIVFLNPKTEDKVESSSGRYSAEIKVNGVLSLFPVVLFKEDGKVVKRVMMKQGSSIDSFECSDEKSSCYLNSIKYGNHLNEDEPVSNYYSFNFNTQKYSSTKSTLIQ